MDVNNETVNKKSRPPYLLGILCLIPLIGAFVGIALLLYGIFKYKDKWLIIIGSFGIIMTISVYSYLFYEMGHGELARNGFAEISQKQLNDLVGSIEFYKLQTGTYPESLQQLSEKSMTGNEIDPLLLSQGKHDNYYNYEKIGNKYKVFSSGIDGIPNTKDDLYPKIEIADTSKIGLILR